jgi:hypothetical protein
MVPLVALIRAYISPIPARKIRQYTAYTIQFKKGNRNQRVLERENCYALFSFEIYNSHV